jgi:hypothetical protein
MFRVKERIIQKKKKKATKSKTYSTRLHGDSVNFCFAAEILSFWSNSYTACNDLIFETGSHSVLQRPHIYVELNGVKIAMASRYGEKGV